ncbi:hypothetical protein [Acidipropionibacterium acidipropionici]|nr:hypothetical protein [Acidipropionibacterium acidipropionici]
MAEPLPSDFLPFGHVVGRVIRAVGDTPADPDSDPEAIPVTGSGLIRFTPLDDHRVVTSTTPDSWVAQETIVADLDDDGLLSVSGTPGVSLWPGAWKVSPGSASAFSFPTFTIEVTSAHTATAPLELWSSAPWTPGAGQTVTTLVVPSGGVAGQILGWDGSALSWIDPGDATQGPAGTVTVGTVTTGAAGSSATVTNSGTPSAAVLDFTIPRGAVGATPANPEFTATASTLAAGSSATASVTGTYPALTLALGIPRGADGTGGGGSSLQIVGAGRPDITSTMDAATQAAVSAATVGTAFISTDGPQGAWAWRRRTTGWQVIDGDTGWRVLEPALTLASGAFKIRRVGVDVWLWLDDVLISTTALASETIAVTIPAGFRPPATAISGFCLASPNWWRADITSGGSVKFPASMTALYHMRDTIHLAPADAWPTTLPGNPTS